jgi:DsbC/DsbD-like thiol-disulfide interchange protein
MAHLFAPLRWSVGCLTAVALTLPGSASANPDLDPSKLVQVRLLADQAGAVAGTTITVGVEYTVTPGWHIYWSNPGDTGMPTQVTFSINGKEVPEIQAQYPIPDSFISPGDLVSFGYSGRVILLADLPVPPDAEGDYVIGISTRYLMCADRCIPGSAKASLTLPVLLQRKASADAEAIAAAREKLPSASLPAGVTVRLNEAGNAVEAVWPASAGAIVGNAGPKGKGGFMLYPDRVPGLIYKTVQVSQLNGEKLGEKVTSGAKATVEFTVGDRARAAGQPIRVVLAWTPLDDSGTPQTTRAAEVILPRN